jgi:transcriptional regulator of NAD metabolism
MKKISDSNASFLSALTDGIHLHTLSAKSEMALDKAVQALAEAGFLIEM